MSEIARQDDVLLPLPVVSPEKIMEAHSRLREWIAGALEAKRDFDILPGTDKKVILKPGIDRIMVGFGLRATFEVIESEVDHDRPVSYDAGRWQTIDDPGRERKEQLKAEFPGRFRSSKDKNGAWRFQERVDEVGTSYGLYRYLVSCRLLTKDGEVVGEAQGLCSSMETKYVRDPRS
ncbi:MAG: hypothetical protein MH204_12760, partial [Fimbriimonadaceae bacterium]|nr:hypothetical protein [Fimbriimonadaceae bacterium]